MGKKRSLGMELKTGEYDSNIAGFKVFYLITFLLAMVWVGIQPVLIPTFILSQTGSAADVALVLALMSLGALSVPLVTAVADRYRAPREVQLVCLLLFGISYFLIGFTQRPLLFGLLALLTGVGVGGASVFSTVYIVAGGYSEEAQAHALALGSRLWLVGQVIGAALVAGMLVANLPFQVMFAVTAAILVISLAVAYWTTRPISSQPGPGRMRGKRWPPLESGAFLPVWHGYPGGPTGLRRLAGPKRAVH